MLLERWGGVLRPEVALYRGKRNSETGGAIVQVVEGSKTGGGVIQGEEELRDWWCHCTGGRGL